jgi:hypothetical protein
VPQAILFFTKRSALPHNKEVEKCMYSKPTSLTDDSIAEFNPRFKTSSPSKLGAAILKHLFEYPDVLARAEGPVSQSIIININNSNLPESEDL